MGVMLVIERPFERLFFVFVFEEGKCGGCAKDFIGFAAQLGFYRGDAGALIANGGVDIAAGIADSDVIGIEGAVFAAFNDFVFAIEDTVNGEFESAAADIVQIVADNFSGARQANGGVIKDGFAHIAFPGGILSSQGKFAEIAFQTDIGFAQAIDAATVFRFFAGKVEIEKCLHAVIECFRAFNAKTDMVA